MITIVAEAGINACGSMALAKHQIDKAAEAGANAVKFQVYHTDKLYNGDTSAPTYEDSKRGEFTHDQLRELAAYCAMDEHIEFFASPFDKEAVELLEEIGVKTYKVATRAVANIELLKLIAQTGKPVIMSISSDQDRLDIDAAFRLFHNVPLILLYCVAQYPAPISSLDFNNIANLDEEYNCPIGFSDHTQGIWASLEAVRCGAVMIEKHFTTSRGLPGCDQVCSIEPLELKLLIESVRQYEEYIKK